MTSFLPSLADTLIDLIHYGDTGALRVTDEGREWVFHVQGGVLVGVARTPACGEELAGSELAARCMTEVMELKTPFYSFEEGKGPDSFGLFDVRHALGLAMGDTRTIEQLLRTLEPVLEGWPELGADADTLTADPAVQAWLAGFDGLAPGVDRIRDAPAPVSRSMGALWVAWKLGDLDLHSDSLIGGDDEDSVAVGKTDPDPDRDQGDDDAAGHRTGPSGAFGAVAASPDDASADEPVADQDTAHTAGTDATAHTDVGGTSGTFAERLAQAVAQDESSHMISAVLEDPFVGGVALARAGNVKAALPLLEDAWAQDPERPGLEEWLGYTRFSALRDSDPDAARAGMDMLRDVMYRTGGGPAQPIQPWVLMARAQYERGDLLQARSVLATALEREPSDPEAMDLDARLQKAEAEAEARRKSSVGPSPVRVAAWLVGVAVLAVFVAIWQLLTPELDPPRVNLASAYADTVALDELHLVGADWFGVYPEDQAPDPTTALADCDALARVAGLQSGHSVTLLSRRGVPLAECGDRLD